MNYYPNKEANYKKYRAAKVQEALDDNTYALQKRGFFTRKWKNIKLGTMENIVNECKDLNGATGSYNVCQETLRKIGDDFRNSNLYTSND